MRAFRAACLRDDRSRKHRRERPICIDLRWVAAKAILSWLRDEGYRHLVASHDTTGAVTSSRQAVDTSAQQVG